MTMKRIALSANRADIELARESALTQNTTLNDLFRKWLREIAERQRGARKYLALMKRLRHVDAGRKFTRDEMNERR
jgi:hypothetical protein